ncbi:NAD(P)-binding protein [Pseudovirgaria hyperparasitica]|uniref:D-xylose 1-dehydrogenase (NADP(+), D-xylono-1,5-lactone-forming) n=1 Tax=Pseudovirgaria hyperparasitica TaxID=470096 RepID=A0A6A6VWI5_9PEZI|nr:NAD(P)-binding protein [Pseudovirgaria hyperparasitica]KAF2754952.1 NAD(P)-binding protein [Pseudovirgaria hyperparasitica]
MSGTVHTVRWGILATGGIARTFTKDLVIDPQTRDVTDIKHQVVAAASSNSSERAEKFLQECGVSGGKAYGSYKELVADANIDVVYVATPHSHHYQHARLCLEAGKNVLCEKAFTTNAAQAKILAQLAKKKGLFLMEAVWTRYFPASREIREIVKSGKLGTVYRVFADVSFGQDVEKDFPPENRMVNMDLAGGVLLDLGIYSLTWVFQILYHCLDPSIRKPPTVVSVMTKYPITGADESTSMVLNFPPHNAHGIATTSIRVDKDPDGKSTAGSPIRIQGTKGEIQILETGGNGFRPSTYRIIPKDPNDASLQGKDVEHKTPPGHGMFWEADEVARCLRDGKQESEGLPLAESIVIMESMDEVRKQNGLVYPEQIESTDYPLAGF